ncbi:hypothetical protein [Streptomyces sp. NPDC002952]|uniref:hypothetical protein n=1 Tax=Streptomyces sp. NPDC002952 TaxID=3364673 RepID=UPI00369512D9
MEKVYERTENGVKTIVSLEDGVAEAERAYADRRGVPSMSSYRGQHHIEYRDGRVVDLVLVDEFAADGYGQGQAVLVTRPGQDPFTGTVAHIHTAPGYVAVLDDRRRAVATYPASFVSLAGAAEEPKAVPATPAGRSFKIIYTGGGEPIVHADGCSHNVRDSLQGAHTTETITGTLEDVAAHVFADFLAEDDTSTPGDFVTDLSVKPCAR